MCSFPQKYKSTGQTEEELDGNRWWNYMAMVLDLSQEKPAFTRPGLCTKTTVSKHLREELHTDNMAVLKHVSSLDLCFVANIQLESCKHSQSFQLFLYLS